MLKKVGFSLNQSDRIKIAKRVVQELDEGQVVNLGVGIPTLIPDYLGINI